MIPQPERQQIIDLIRREVVPAIGCTEPIAVALCTARAAELLGALPEKIAVRLRAKIRYRMAEQPCSAEQTGEDTIRLTFDSPQRAITPGQIVVLYDGDTVVGGARIRRAGAAERKEWFYGQEEV